ncbi:LPS export ABC transporter permease LptG [Parahaliea mediterranea]|uniref:LPS export ABC transporter permease LptG n=1 Tax=Parahaliea mediterranea TaxID=651086 RepID=UPI000E2E6746|nr:LPS export ABC transporter permease LptG [Parahaliea mediterranea]
MRGLDRYLARTVVLATALVLAIIVGLDAVTAFIDESGDISESYTALEVLIYVVLTLPGRLYEFTPFATMIGCLVGLGQLASSSELVVMRAAGVSIARIVWIVMKPTLVIALVAFLLGEYVAPRAEQLAQSRRAIAQNPGEGVAGRHGLWNREGDTFLHFNALDPDGEVFGVILLQFDERLQLQSALRAQSATFAGDHWQMHQAVRTDFSSWQTTRTPYDTLRWDTAITPELLTMEVVSPDKLPLVDLYRYSRYLAQQGLEAEDFELAMWRKLLQPLTVAGLVLVAISFIFGPLRDGTLGFRIFAGVLVGIVFRTSQDLLGPASLVFGFAPLYAALVPVLLSMGVGLLLLRRAQ